MKNTLIGIILKSLQDSYDEGACDDLSKEELEDLLLDLSILKDKLENKLDKVLTIEETSMYLNVTRLTLNNYVKEGKLKPKKHLGGVMEFKLKDIKNFIKMNKQ